jgi:hypothetical protein
VVKKARKKVIKPKIVKKKRQSKARVITKKPKQVKVIKKLAKRDRKTGRFVKIILPKRKKAVKKPAKRKKVVKPVSVPTKRKKVVSKPVPVKRKKVVSKPVPVKRKKVVSKPVPVKRKKVVSKPVPTKRKKVVSKPVPVKRKRVVKKPVRRKKLVVKPLAAKRKPRPKKHTEIDYIRVGSHMDYHTATHLSTDPQKEHYKNFSHLTRTDLEPIVLDVFDAALDGHMNKMGIEYEDLRIFSFGVLFRPDGKELTQSLISEIAIMVQDYRAKITVAEEDNGQHAVMINFGRDTKRVTAEFVRNKLERISDVLQQIYVLLYDELECDIDWDVWWDTDEVMY